MWRQTQHTETFFRVVNRLLQHRLHDDTGILYREYYETLSPEVQTALSQESPIYQTHYERCLTKTAPKFQLTWVTINPKEGTSPATVLKLCDNIVKKTWIKKAWYTLEQRGKTSTEMGKGIHIHMLLTEHSKPKSHIHREILNTVKNYVGNSMHVKVQDYPHTFLEDKLDYIFGKKWDEEKNLSIEVDKIWRAENNLENYYLK